MWLVVTIGILAAGVLLWQLVKKRFPKFGKLVLAVTVVFLCAVSLVTGICWTAPDTDTKQADYALLLGSALEDGEAPPELYRRMELALHWLQQTEKTPLVVSGGDVKGYGITEAEVMYDWLAANGADMTRVYMEPESTDTKENVRFSSVLMKCQERETDTVLIITADYHQTRARFLAERNGQTALGLGCHTPFAKHLSAAVREFYSFTNEILEIVLDNLRPVLSRG